MARRGQAHYKQRLGSGWRGPRKGDRTVNTIIIYHPHPPPRSQGGKYIYKSRERPCGRTSSPPAASKPCRRKTSTGFLVYSYPNLANPDTGIRWLLTRGCTWQALAHTFYRVYRVQGPQAQDFVLFSLFGCFFRDNLILQSPVGLELIQDPPQPPKC